jgi:hypothetical protein
MSSHPLRIAPAPSADAPTSVEHQFLVPRRAPAAPNPNHGVRAAAFSRNEIVAAIREWVEVYGEPPTTCDWEPARARRLGQEWRARRFETGAWPSARMVRGQFSTFNAAIEAAGLTPRPAPTRVRRNLSGPEAILDALIEWTRRYGDVPTMADWDPTRARRLGQEWRIARYHQGDWPSARTVAVHFGSFAKAAAAAGLVARHRSAPHAQRRSEQSSNRLAAARASGASSAPGIDDLAISLRALARARASQDPVALHAALIDLAGSALAWAEAFGSD